MRTTNRPTPHADLSREEARLTALLAAGCPTDVIAREMGVSSVELHRILTALGQKVDASSANA